MSKPQLLIIGPDDDISIDLFLSAGQGRMDITSALYTDSLSPDKTWDFIYIRGPFINADYYRQDIRDSIENILQTNKQAYVLDGIHSFSDLLMEDKWRQYELFKDIMPETELLDLNGDLKGKIIKKRISGRSRDIHFDPLELKDGVKPQDYIVQRRLDVEVEYRAFMVGGRLELPLEIKSTKSETGKTKVIGMQPDTPSEVAEICQKVASKLNYDFMGLDIAKTGEGYSLIEVNRSPQFMNFYKWNSINLAEKLIDYLLEKIT